MNKLVGIISFLLLSGCDDYWKHYKLERTYVEAVYYHERNNYSVAILEKGQVKMVDVPYPIITVNETIDKPWYECDYTFNTFNGKHKGNCTVYINSIDSLNTAGWNHGKFGSGTTTRIR